MGSAYSPSQDSSPFCRCQETKKGEGCVDEFRKRKGKQTEIDQTEIPRPHSIADKLLHHEASCNIDTVDSEKAEDVFLVRAKK